MVIKLTSYISLILKELRKLNSRLDAVLEHIGRISENKIEIDNLDEETKKLLALPDNLRKTYLILEKRMPLTAEDISLSTGRARACESSYLNQLITLGYLLKKKEGHKTSFCKRRI